VDPIVYIAPIQRSDSTPPPPSPPEQKEKEKSSVQISLQNLFAAILARNIWNPLAPSTQGYRQGLLHEKRKKTPTCTVRKINYTLN
jgi:hypothetical protein